MIKSLRFGMVALLVATTIRTGVRAAEDAPANLAGLPAPLGVPAPGPTNSAPYAPQPIVAGGVVVPLYPPGSPLLKEERAREAEQYNLSKSVPGRINSIVNIHNPSIEVHTVDSGINTGAAIILAAGGGHNTLNVGSESADFVPYFYGYGVNTVILRNRLRRDGYTPHVDGVNDAFQAIRTVRAHAKDWHIDPNKIGIMGFSAGAELAAWTAVFFDEFQKTNSPAGDPLAGVSARPDFVALIYPGPSPFARGECIRPIRPTRPRRLSCAAARAIACMRFGPRVLVPCCKRIPNVEMHIYGNGRHPGEVLSDGSHMTAGLSDRNGIPIGKWQDRFIDWFRDLGFLQKPDMETRAAKDVAAHVNPPPRAPNGSK